MLGSVSPAMFGLGCVVRCLFIGTDRSGSSWVYYARESRYSVSPLRCARAMR